MSSRIADLQIHALQLMPPMYLPIARGVCTRGRYVVHGVMLALMTGVAARAILLTCIVES